MNTTTYTFSHSLIAILFFSCFSFPLLAQEKAHTNEAQKLLNDIDNFAKSKDNMQFDFTLTVEDIISEKNQVFDIKAYVKNEQFKLIFDKQTIICNGNEIWTYHPELEEVHVSNYDEVDENTINPANFIKTFIKDYHLDIHKGIQKTSSDYTNIIAKPKNADNTYFKVEIAIDKEKNIVPHFKVFEQSGLRYTYAMKNHEYNASQIDSSFFSFDTTRYPDVEVVDLR